MKRSLGVLAVASLVFAGVASAEVKKGDIMIDFLAGWTQQNFPKSAGGGSASVYFGALRPGVALTDNIRVAGFGAVAHATASGGGGHVTVWALGASGEYVFMPASQFNPYVGGEIAYANASTGGGVGQTLGNQDGWLVGPRAGALFTLNKTNNLFGEFHWDFYQGNLRNAVRDGYMLLFGIEHKFKVG
jgi:hypothetical protein